MSSPVSRTRVPIPTSASLYCTCELRNRKGTLAIYDSSAVFGFEIPAQTRGYNDRNLKSTALAAGQVLDPTNAAAAALGGHQHLSRFHRRAFAGRRGLRAAPCDDPCYVVWLCGDQPALQ